MKGAKHDYSQLIIWSALAVTVARYIGAFVASDVGEITGGWSIALTVLMAISGIGMGFLDVLGLAYVFDGWRGALPKTDQSWKSWSNRFKVLTFFVVALFVVGVGILVPFTVSRIMADSMEKTLGAVGAWWWGLAVNLAPYLLIGGVTFSQSGFVTIKQDATSALPSATKTQPVAREVAESNRDKVLRLHHEKPDATQEQIALLVGISRQQVGKYLKQNGYSKS